MSRGIGHITTTSKRAAMAGATGEGGGGGQGGGVGLCGFGFDTGFNRDENGEYEPREVFDDEMTEEW